MRHSVCNAGGVFFLDEKLARHQYFSYLWTMKIINLIPRVIRHEDVVYPASDGIRLAYLMQFELGEDISPKATPPEIEEGVYYIVSPVAYMLHGKPKNFIMPVWKESMVSNKITGFCPPRF